MYGGVGTGKTMLMDAFYAHVPVQAKVRVSFHTFMLDVFDRINKWKQANPNPVRQTMMADVARDLVGPPKGSWLLCFDEFQVTDIGTAMMIKQLFEACFAQGAIVLATSNRAPSDLYLGGLQRESFLPFIDYLEQTSVVHHLSSTLDYRALLSAESRAPAYLPTSVLDSAFASELAEAGLGPHNVAQTQLQVMMGRSLTVPRAAGKIGWMTWDALCNSDVGPSDYLALTQAFHTLFLADVPQMGDSTPNQARRFITLIDLMYEAGIKVVIGTDTPIESLYTGEKLRQGASTREDVAFAFDRTISRLLEMNSDDYLDTHTQRTAATTTV